MLERSRRLPPRSRCASLDLRTAHFVCILPAPLRPLLPPRTELVAALPAITMGLRICMLFYLGTGGTRGLGWVLGT